MNYAILWYILKMQLVKEVNGENFKVGGSDNAAKMLILMSEIETDEVIGKKEGE